MWINAVKDDLDIVDHSKNKQQQPMIDQENQLRGKTEYI
jgi:hypothetical protein